MSPSKTSAVAAACLVLMVLAACNKETSTPAGSGQAPPAAAQAAMGKESPLAWNTRTLVTAYESFGKRKAEWDEPARAALNEFARVRARLVQTNEAFAQILSTNCAAALRAGCDDPLIGYLHVRFVLTETSTNDAQLGEAYARIADALQQSSYDPLRKFYASLRAAQTLKAASTNPTNISPAVYKFRSASIDNLVAALQDKRMPGREADEACHELLAVLKSNHAQYEHAYNHLEPVLSANWPNESFVFLLKGAAHIEMAWRARGTEYADKVTRNGWKGLAEHLGVAEQALEHAWALDPHDVRIPATMLTVELGQGQGRERMELWFKRAMELDPNNYEACRSKLYYLEPKWYGSEADMLEFGRECVQTNSGGGEVPLILADAHWHICRGYHHAEDSYWQDPEVWDDLNAAFKRFFELNPQATGWHHNYAWYAYKCAQWPELNRQLKVLGWTNYEYFGGKAEFDKMARAAAEHATDTRQADKK